MAYTTESLDVAINHNPSSPSREADMPVKEFVGYDPKGTTSITGSPLVKPEQVNPKQTDTVETTEVAESPPAEESVRLSPKISAIARKEQAQRQREMALRQREKALEAKLADADKYAQLKTKIASKDYSAADELGMTHEEYTKYLLDKQAGEDPGEQRYRKIEEEISQFKKNQEEQTAREYQANQTLWKQEISKVVTDNEAFSTIKELGAEAAVLQHINDSFNEDGIELTAEQAAQEIEDALVERAEKFAGISKIKNKVSEAKVLGPPKSTPKTITQNMTVSSGKPSTKPFHLMSESEQIAEAFRRVQAAKQQR